MTYTHTLSTLSAQNEVIKHISNTGITPPNAILFDGEVHRFGRKKSGWYIAHLNPVPICVYGDWSLGIQFKYVHQASKPLTPAKQSQLRNSLKVAKQKWIDDQEQKYKAAKLKAKKLWDEAEPALFHEYLRRKQVLPLGARIDGHGNLLIPLMEIMDDLKVSSLQFIQPDGTKRFLKGGKVRGYCYPIGLKDQTERILICEGFATGATLYMDTNLPVIVAINSGNLKPVAEKVRMRFPEAQILICGDDDHGTEGNPGKEAAIKAAIACGGRWIIPDFSALNSTSKDTDFNDLSRLQRSGS